MVQPITFDADKRHLVVVGRPSKLQHFVRIAGRLVPVFDDMGQSPRRGERIHVSDRHMRCNAALNKPICCAVGRQHHVCGARPGAQDGGVDVTAIQDPQNAAPNGGGEVGLDHPARVPLGLP